MTLTPQDKKYLTNIIKRNIGPMKESRVFLSLFSEDMKKEPIPILQLGMAVLMDKPIALMVKRGAKVPKHIIKIATAIEYLEDDSPQSIQKVTSSLMEKMRDYLQ